MKKPLFLVSNDDGAGVDGLEFLVSLLRPLGEVAVVVPDRERSGMSTAFTTTHPLVCQCIVREPGYTLHTCNGTPVDCVKYALNLLLKDRRPDYVFSGINHGYNASVAIHYSGTLGAALEGCMAGIPSIGISYDSHARHIDFEPTRRWMEPLIAKLLSNGLPSGACLNVNIPKGEIRGIRVCRQGAGHWLETLLPADGPGSDAIPETGAVQTTQASSDQPAGNGAGAVQPSEPAAIAQSAQTPKSAQGYWLSGIFVNGEPEATDNDMSALDGGYISVVPQQVDMTDYALLAQMKHWNL